MNWSEESYYGRRPRFAGTDDIVGLMQSGTAQSVDTINRTGEQLARTYGAIPKLFGEGIRGGVEGFYKGKEDALNRLMAEEDRARAKETFDQSKELRGLQISAAKRSEEEAKKESEWWDSPYMAPGQAGPLPPTGLGMTKRQSLREATLGDSIADIGRKSELHDLNKALTEESILTQKSQRGASAAQNALNKKLLEMQIKDAEEQKLLQALEIAAGQDLTAPPQMAGDVGPARPQSLAVDQVLASMSGLDPIRAQTLAGTARRNAAQAIQQGSMIGRTVDPAGREIQQQLLSLQGKLPQVANLAGVVSRYSQVPTEKLGTDDAARALAEVGRGLEGAAFSPEQAQQLKQMAQGEGFRPLSGASDLFRGNESGGFYQTSQEGSVEATKSLLESYRTQAQNALAQATTYGDVNMKNQAQYILAGIDRYLSLIGAGANPGTHNRFVPQQQQQSTFSMPQGAPTMNQGVQQVRGRYDGRG